MNGEPRGEFVVMFEVPPALTTKTFFEITGRKPDERARQSIQSVVQPRRGNTKRTHVVADHDLVLEPVSDIAVGPKPGRIGRTHEFIGDMPAVHVEPKREITLDAARAG